MAAVTVKCQTNKFVSAGALILCLKHRIYICVVVWNAVVNK